MKTVNLQPINEPYDIKTEGRVLDVLLAKKLKVLMSCGGKGLCATCHVYVTEGMDKLTPMTEREKRTLNIVSNCTPESRLACQSRVLGDGVTVRVPEAMYLERLEDLDAMIGKRALTHILNPKNGALLIEKGKIITRSRISQLQHVKSDLEELRTTAGNDLI